MNKFLLAVALVMAIATSSLAAVGVLDQSGNLWSNATTAANVPCDASNDIYLGRVTNASILGFYNWTSGPTPIPELWFSVDQSTWYSVGAPFGVDAAKDGKVMFRGAILDGNPSAPWMQLRMCSAVTGLTVTVIGLQQR